MFKDWFKARGGDGSIDVKQAIERIEHLLVTNDSPPKTHLPNSTAEISSNLDPHNWQVGDLVIHADPYHTHGADTGIVEKVIDYRLLIWWEGDGEDQIAAAFRTYGVDELKAA